MRTEFWMEHFLENGRSEERERNWRIIRQTKARSWNELTILKFQWLVGRFVSEDGPRRKCYIKWKTVLIISKPIADVKCQNNTTLWLNKKANGAGSCACWGNKEGIFYHRTNRHKLFRSQLWS